LSTYGARQLAARRLVARRDRTPTAAARTAIAASRKMLAESEVLPDSVSWPAVPAASAPPAAPALAPPPVPAAFAPPLLPAVPAPPFPAAPGTREEEPKLFSLR